MTVVSEQDLLQRTLPCKKCKATFAVALPQPGDRKTLAKMLSLRADERELIAGLQESTGCEFGDAVVTFRHLAKAGCCHGCGSPVPSYLFVDCSACSRLNVQLSESACRLPCPACGFVVLHDAYGSYEICPVCGWEDDGMQLSNPTSGGGANAASLAEKQLEVLARIPQSVRVHGDFGRDPKWRPLDATEIAEAERERAERHWHHRAACEERESYWVCARCERGV